jgi:hypothetical protein
LVHLRYLGVAAVHLTPAFQVLENALHDVVQPAGGFAATPAEGEVIGGQSADLFGQAVLGRRVARWLRI